MSGIQPFSDEQNRLLVNLRQRYEVWMAAEQELAAMPYDLRKKTVTGLTYLYEILDRGGNGKSLGRWNDAVEAQFTDYHARKTAAKERRDLTRVTLTESGRLYRALRLPLLSSAAGPILREADRRSLLGSHLLVIGTNAMAAYALEAAGLIREAPDETEDFDLAWISAELESPEWLVWNMLKAVDPTFAINTERDFQARNSKAYEVELLVAPSRASTVNRKDQPRPLALPEQEWLLLGTPVDHVVGCRDGSPARIIAPDPRWFALHKLWMADQAKRNPLKRSKDRKQGTALLSAVAEAMPRYPMDAAFQAQLPTELSPYFEDWKALPQTPEHPTWK
jgi:hypothetical protein